MKWFCFFIIIFLININLFSYDWTVRQITILDSTNDNAKTIDTLQDKDGSVFKVSYTDNLRDEDVNKVIGLKNQLFGWHNLTIKALEFTFSKNILDIFILPSKLEFEGIDVVDSLPAGMLFFYTDALRFDFRMNKENMFLRINGKFNSEADFAKKIMSAYSDPMSYLKRNDPAYIPSRVEDT